MISEPGSIRPIRSWPRWLCRTRKAAVAIVGVGVLALGIAFLFLPAPGSVVIPIGLAILGTEFLWARRLSVRVRRILARFTRRRPARHPDPCIGTEHQLAPRVPTRAA